MINLNTNLSSLITLRSLATSTQRLNQAIEQMTTGFKINHAKDNAANYNITTNMTTKIGAYMVAEDNCAMGLDLLATANGSLDQIADKLQRLRTLAVQVSNGTYGTQSKEAINQEANAIVDEIERIYNTTEYNGIKLFDNEPQYELPDTAPRAQYDGFIKEVVKRDTSAMTTLASVDGSVALADGTYSISTPEEMKKLADMTNAGLVSAGDEFVLANDIDLSQYENWTPIGEIWFDSGWSGNWFRGKFDGNGYVIKNVTCEQYTHASTAALFGGIESGEIKNLGIVDSTFSGIRASSLTRTTNRSTLTNIFSSNCNITATEHSGGLVIDLYRGSLSDSYTLNNTITGQLTGGITYQNGWDSSIENCFSDNEIVGFSCSAGIVAHITGNQLKIKNTYVMGGAELSGVFAVCTNEESVTIEDSGYSEYYLGKPLVFNSNGTDVIANVKPFLLKKNHTNLQVGINSESNDRISVNTSFYGKGVSVFRFLGNVAGDYVTISDILLAKMLDKQTEFGAAQNRLESALDEISVQYENLVSSRSTLRDADISEVSSEYIRQQILQQASATLMATANQSPSIALQLI